MTSNRLKRYDEYLDDLTYLIEKGFICPLHYGSFSDTFSEKDRYIKLREKNDLLRKQEQEKSELEYEVLLPKNYNEERKYPLFISLHGDGDSIDFHKEYWKSHGLLDKGFIVVYLQSSQITSHNEYAWLKRVFNELNQENWRDSEDIYKISESSYLIKECYDTLHNELKGWYKSINNKYSIDENSIVVGGFSGGDTAAIEITLINSIPVKGFVTVSTQKPNIFSENRLNDILNRGVKCVFMEGEEDVPVKEVDDMIKKLKEKGIPYKYYINKDIGHWYPNDLDDKLEKALNFILI